MDDLLELLRSAELALQQPSTRNDASKIEALLHESFIEIGRSGASYDRAATISLLTSEEMSGRIVSQDFSLTSLGSDVALLTYCSAIIDDSEEIHSYALRSSIWTHTPDGWRLRFHQGTPTEAFKITDQ